jgi:hypothetical protein
VPEASEPEPQASEPEPQASEPEPQASETRDEDAPEGSARVQDGGVPS